MTSMATNGIRSNYMNNIDENGVPYNIPNGRYHAVWVQLQVGNNKGKWVHHYSASSREDARDEAAYCKRSHGEVTKIVRQDW